MESINFCNLGCARDCISNLPEDVLSEILSRLPTKDAIRTSILSKAWEYKWTSTYNVDIYDGAKEAIEASRERNKHKLNLEIQNRKFGIFNSFPDCKIWAEQFANFMDRIIRSCKCFKKFSLQCGHFYDSERAQAWISAALGQKLESFEVSCPVEGVVYPCSLLKIASLKNLKVRNGTLNVATKNIVANLTRLDFFLVKIVNEDPNTRTVAFTFPVLETLLARWCSWLKPVEINAPSLATFRSHSRNSWEENPCSFALIAPRLSKFDAEFNFPEKFILTGSSIVSATIKCKWLVIDDRLCTKIGIQVGNLLNQLLANAEHLELGTYHIKVSQWGPPLHCHDKLTKLTINDPVNPGILCHILHAAPSLKYVKMVSQHENWGMYVDEWEVETVPSCILYQLEEVVFSAVYPDHVRYNMARFLLKNGGALKKLTLGGCGSDLSLDTRKGIFSTLLLCPKSRKTNHPGRLRDILLGFPRSSANVIIE